MNYERIYNQIIQRAREEQEQRIQNKKDGGHYYEGHHIIPECMGGEGRADDWIRINRSNRHPNIVGLTAKEHFLCHQLLCLIYPNNDKILFAAWAMVNGLGKKERYKPSARVYEDLKIRFGRNRHDALKGVPKTEEHKKNLRKPKSEAHKMNMRKPKSEDHKAKLSKALQGHIISEETRKKISERTKGRTPWNKGISRTPLTEEQKKKVSEGVRRSYERRRIAIHNPLQIDNI